MTNSSTKTVLVVEDNDLNMKLFSDLLKAHGYNVLQTRDGMEALGLVPLALTRLERASDG